MLDVVTPTCRAISTIDNPNSSTPHFAIVARTVLTFLRPLPHLISFALLRPYMHSSSIIFIRALPVRRNFSCLGEKTEIACSILSSAKPFLTYCGVVRSIGFAENSQI
jgi:hypothetical protein